MDLLTQNSPAVFGEGGATLTHENGLVRVSDRKFPYASLAARCDLLLGTREAYHARYELRLDSDESLYIGIYYKVEIEYLNLAYTYYEYGRSVLVTGREFASLEADLVLPPDAVVKALTVYFIQDGKSSFPDVLVRAAALEKATAPAFAPVSRGEMIERQKKMTFGVVRWDAYFKTEGSGENSVSAQVSRSLSPAHYHFMAPYFSRVHQDGHLDFGEATQAQFDREAELAVKAGIDYFAYCWYRNNDPMSYARRQHVQSPWRDKLKMTAIINVNAMDEETARELGETMAKDFWLTFDGRPVLFVYDAFRVKKEYIDRVVRYLQEAGVDRPPYLAAMGGAENPLMLNELARKGFDCVSGYGCAASATAEPYEKMTARLETSNAKKYSMYEKIDIIPQVSCGRDQRPRIEHPTTWAHGYGQAYVIPPTGQELYEHASRVLKDLREHPERNRPNSVMCYAWNEHDEGGWCCPTLAVDAKGEPIEDENGQPLINSTYLNALARAIREYRENE